MIIFSERSNTTKKLIIISPLLATRSIVLTSKTMSVILLFKLSRFRKAHEYLDHARRLLVSVRDKVRVAQVDDTRAQVFIAQQDIASRSYGPKCSLQFQESRTPVFLS